MCVLVSFLFKFFCWGGGGLVGLVFLALLWILQFDTCENDLDFHFEVTRVRESNTIRVHFLTHCSIDLCEVKSEASAS